VNELAEFTNLLLLKLRLLITKLIAINSKSKKNKKYRYF